MNLTNQPPLSNRVKPSNSQPVLSSDDLKRKKVNLICGEFLKTAKDDNRHLYALTITPHKSHVWRLGIWSDLNKREDYILDLFDLFELTLKRFLNNNWKSKKSKPVYVLGAIEHTEKNSTTLVSPHIHAIAAVQPLYHLKYQSLISTDSNLLNLNSFPFAAWIKRKSEIDSIHSVQLSTEKDITDWCSYSFGMDKFTFNTRDVRNGQMRSFEGLNTLVRQS
jgi:hypothetical protein